MKNVFPIGILFIFSFSGVTSIAVSVESPERLEEEAALEEWLRGDELKALEIPGLDDLLRPLPLWNSETKISAAIGHRNNVMLSAVEPKEGGFVLAGLESSLLRLPPEGPRFSLFLHAEHLQFFSNDLPNDTSVAAHSEASFTLPRDLTLQFRWVGYYLDQVMDLSTLQAPIPPVQVRGYGLSPGVSLRKKWQNKLFVETSALALWQEYQAPLYDYLEYGPKIAAGFSPASSETSLSLQYLERDYDDRPARSAEGAELPTELNFQILRPEVQVSYAWGEGSRWRSRSLLGLEFVRDNESDYFSYDRIRLYQQLAFQQGSWKLQGRVSYSLFDYEVQTVPGTGETRRRHSWGAGLEAGRNLTDRLQLFARYDFEKVRSNEPETDYQVDTMALGLTWKL